MSREKGRQKAIVKSRGHAYAGSAEQPMKVDGQPRRSIWLATDGWAAGVIDQPGRPHHLATAPLTTLDAAAAAITRMVIRGAPLIGATAVYGMCLALRQAASADAIARAYKVGL